jgi:phytoene synthase
LWLAAEALGAPDQRTRAALTPLGIAWSLLGLARAIPHHARQRRQYLPAEIAAEAGLSAQDLFAPKPCPALARAVARLVETAQRRLAEAEAGAVAAAARPLLLYGTLARAQAERLRRCHFDVTRAASDVPSWRKIALLWWAARRL